MGSGEAAAAGAASSGGTVFGGGSAAASSAAAAVTDNPPATQKPTGTRKKLFFDASVEGVIERAIKDKPYYHSDSNPPGYKIWVGDLAQDTSHRSISKRIWDTLLKENRADLWDKIHSVVLKKGRADSGACYVVITVGHLASAQDGPLT